MQASGAFTYKKSVNIEQLMCELGTHLIYFGNTYAGLGVGIEAPFALTACPALAYILFKERTGFVAGLV